MDTGHGYGKRHVRDSSDKEYGLCNAEVKSNTRLSLEELERTRESINALTDNLGKGYALSELEYKTLRAAWGILCDVTSAVEFPRLTEKLTTGGVKKYKYNL